MYEFVCHENIKYLKAQLSDSVVGSEPKQNAKRETIRKLIEGEERHLREILDGKE